MKLTIDSIAQVLGLSRSYIDQALAESGIVLEENNFLSEEEMKQLRPALLRFYQSSRSITLEKSSGDVSESHDGSVKTDSCCDSKTKVRSNASDYDKKESTFERLHNEKEPKVVDSIICNDTAEYSDSFLEQLVVNHIIMLDTCSIMHEGCDLLIESMCPLLKKHNKKIIVPNKVIQELEKHYNSWSDPEKSKLAENGLHMCQRLKQEGCLSVRGGDYDNFADNVFFVNFSILRFKYNLVLITQDNNLSQDILQLNDMQTGSGKPVRVFKVSRNGALIEITK